nr:Subtilisin-like protease [Triticum aestivum]
MAPSIINNDAVQGETFLPRQIFVFGGFALRANSLGHLEQIKSYAPGHQVKFGSLNYTADVRGDLIFDGFEPQPSVPHCCDGHDLALPPDSALEAAPVSAPTLSSEPTAPIEDGWLDTTSGAAISTAIEPYTNPVPCEARDSKVPDSSPDSEPSAPLLIESDWAPIMEFTAADIF